MDHCISSAKIAPTSFAVTETEFIFRTNACLTFYKIKTQFLRKHVSLHTSTNTSGVESACSDFAFAIRFLFNAADHFASRTPKVKYLCLVSAVVTSRASCC
jgi:hypothetical protein